VPAATTEASFVDEASCAACHPEQAAAWTGSHHDLAMQEAGDSTVLGDFEDARFTHGGVTSRFLRRDGRFFVETDGHDGELAEFEISHAFGVTPLQQYLVPFPGGRHQALGLAWDVPGQRWFHLYPDEEIDHEDGLHWTQRAQNWNWQCAECHATDLRRGWDPEAGGYRTTAARFDVGCQACHGPGSEHERLAAAANEGGPAPVGAASGLVVDLGALDSSVEIEACARCHSRRAPLGDGYSHEGRLLDDYLPSLIAEGLYHADGQILDEVYVWGSFVQSRMHAKGLRCSDCHDPHAAGATSPDDGTCVACHSPGGAGDRPHVDESGLQRKDYASPAHHFHEAGGPGSACVDCHAPPRTYMVVDPRHDHSFRIPRPDLSVRLGTPDGCTHCHVDRDAAWAAGRVAEWHGPERRQEPHPGEAIHAGRTGAPGAAPALTALAADQEAPAIFRATAVALLSDYPSLEALSAWRGALGDADALVRHAAVRAFESLPPRQVAPLLAPLLRDPVKAVRIAAARRLVAAGEGALGPHASAWWKALAEWEAVQEALGGQPEALGALGSLRAEQGFSEMASESFEAALRLDPRFVPAAVNLADLRSSSGDEAGAERALREALRRAPDDAALHHALGLSLVRQGRRDEALAALAVAAREAPEDARFGFVHAVALHDAGRREEAEDELERVLEARPQAREARLALASWRAQAGREPEARQLLAELAAINPGDPALATGR
jgi:tetratricopeptide (TPR) repeat protein